jgi:hypothetical protein
MTVLMVRDDAIPDLDDVLLKSYGPEASQVCLLSEFISAHGYRYDSTAGRFVADQERSTNALPSKPCLLVNRVVEVSTQTCTTLADGSFLPMRGQVNHVYERILSRYDQPYSSVHCYSTTGKLVPLFTQWRMAKDKMPWLEVPEYRYGYGPEIIDTSGLRAPIYKTPFNLYDWRPNSPPEGIPFDSFVVDRPKGDPLIAFFCGDHIAMRWLADGRSVSAEIVEKLTNSVRMIKEIFSAFLGESLWFIDGENTVFACFSHRLSAAQRYPDTVDLFRAALNDARERLHSNFGSNAVNSFRNVPETFRPVSSTSS